MKWVNDLNKFILKDKKKMMEYLLIIAAFGAALIVVAGMFEPQGLSKQSKKSKQTASQTAIEDKMEAMRSELESLLSNIKGAGEVQLMLSFDSTTEHILARETSQDLTEETENGASSVSRQYEDRIIMKDTENGSEPAVVKEVLPQPKGVLVVAEGADNLQVKEKLIAGVKAITGLAEYKIQVLPAN